MNEALLDEFEEAWREGIAPSFEEYWHRLGGTSNEHAFFELLCIELYYRAKAGLAVTEAEYLARFPQQQFVVKRVFLETRQQSLVIGQLMVEFENSWRTGKRPAFSNFLSRVSGNMRNYLLQQLVPLDAKHRQQVGEVVTVDDYRELCESVGLDPAACLSGLINPTPSNFAAKPMDVTSDYLAPEQADGRSMEFDVKQRQTTDVRGREDRKLVVSRIGRYRIERVLGKGGFGLVYMAHDEQLDRRVAIKVPHAHLIGNPNNIATYISEARTVANLDHPHVVPVYDVGTSPDVPCFIVSKYIEGSDLASLLKAKRVNYLKAAQWIAAIAEALHYAHKRGLVHRDVKPGNIMIGKDQQPYVVDFGLALREENIGQGPQFAGTPAYMSPEQARGEGHRVDGRSDIFSLGAVFYELLSGRRAFRGDTLPEIYQQIINYEPKPPRQYDEEIPKELERICHKTLAKRATDRYSTAFDLAQDLRLFLQEHVQLNSGDSPATTAASPTSDNTRLSGNSRISPLPIPVTPITPEFAESQPVKIVPKGLRSFDSHDADFFLGLVPGPRDREGLPDSLRFWKTRIEENDSDATFSVGLIFGPSGCGKSSLVKAGLLPRLSNEVVVVYLEATPDETETRLLHGLRKRCTALDENLCLKATLAAVRRGQGIPVGKKLLIVLDQFEQWLHAKKEEGHADLVEALRQCDGGRVQCILMVRDDFWLAVSRFLRELEVPLIEGQNIALVDLFDRDHARKVLSAFGRAFGKLSVNSSDTTKEQREFITQSVVGLTEEGKVICVRLALFAEMMKSKIWAPSTLKVVGGTKGIGATFLEETFSSSAASPKHRYHQKAARAVLKSLLPEMGTDIKGMMRSYSELLEASGYGNRPRDFDDLIRILDSEIRLITPTDPEGKDAEGASVMKIQAGQKYFQLTHDYLVHSLRDWLTRKQKETRKGRAELKLFDTSMTWNSKSENRFLPSLVDFLNIYLLTDSGRWTEPQRKMMHRAVRVHGLTWGGTVAVLLVLAFSLQYWVSQRDWVNKQQQTRIAAESLQNNLGPSIPVNIRELQKLPDSLVLAELQERFNTRNPRRKLAVAFALAAYGQIETDYLVSRIDNVSIGDTANYIDALAADRWRAVAALKAAADQCASESLWRRKAKLAIAALALGDTGIAANMCRYEDRPDPGQRTVFIHEFPEWEWSSPNRQIDLSQLAKLVADSQDSGLRSGISLGVGRLQADQLRELNFAGLETWQKLASRWYAEHRDTSTHSTSIWLLRSWNLALPEVPDQDQIRPDRDWFVNTAGMTMARIRPVAHKLEEKEIVDFNGEQSESTHDEPPPPLPILERIDLRDRYRIELMSLGATESLTELGLYKRVMANFHMGDFKAALADLHSLLESGEVTDVAMLSAYRILALARSGDLEGASETFEELKNTLSKSLELYVVIQLLVFRGEVRESMDLLNQVVDDETLGEHELYHAASAAAVCAHMFFETSPEIFAQFEQIALGLLDRLVRMGYSNEQYLRHDPDFAAFVNEKFDAIIGRIVLNKTGYSTERLREYWLATCPVTEKQFEAFLLDTGYAGEKPADFQIMKTDSNRTSEHPAQGVSWNDAVMYCNWLSVQERKTPAYRKAARMDKGEVLDSEDFDRWELVNGSNGYRLLSESEWEYGCRAGTSSKWSCGNDEGLVVEYCQMYPSKHTSEAGQRLPNAWGLHDMHGNVWEWCENRFDTNSSDRVIRGGSWTEPAANCRSANRSKSFPANRSPAIGFRVALSSPSGTPDLGEPQ